MAYKDENIPFKYSDKSCNLAIIIFSEFDFVIFSFSIFDVISSIFLSIFIS